ncbi:MAG: DEAD/DEAH box helicase family protein [Sedimentisphaerales bacterium]|nr:DEAD/DEAH box helicase family protein [Sedimentisphaerales bacterium]
MAFVLKDYQQRCLDELAGFFRQTNKLGKAKLAFYEKTNRTYQDVKELPDLPYVCLRVPTGGGKTVMAAHAVGVTAEVFLQADKCLVLWLAPTTQIVSQTVKALQDKRHPYRQALDAAFGGRVTVMELSAATTVLKPAALSSDTVIVVSTMQAPRVGDKEGRKIYAEDNGSLMDHFNNLNAEQMALLDKTEEGKPAYSLANVFKLHRPVIVVDEAHNARTPLSFETLARFNPACIIEFTATPANDSNVLTAVSAMELKAEQMIKLPIRLRTRPQWKEAIQDALVMQAKLEKDCQEELQQTGEYIRPIVLFQAQRQGDGNITFDLLKQSLMEDFSIPETHIAISTGAVNDLDNTDILTAGCDIRYIITVDKLREGWDCPFAYVLCSVSNLTSKTAVEQIMGRVLRMPHAQRKKHDELNHAYAFVTSQGFVDAANSLTEALIDSGFNPYEAKQSIKPAEQTELPFDLPLWNPIKEVFATKPDLSRLSSKFRECVTIHQSGDSTQTVVTYSGPPITEDQEKKWKACLDNEDDKDSVTKLARKSRKQDAWPAALGKRFRIPWLSVRSDKILEVFEDQFRDFEWKLSECDPLLTQAEFSLPSGTETGAEIDVEEGKLTWHSFTEVLHRQLTFWDTHAPKTENELLVWLDRSIVHPDISQAEMGLYLKKAITALQKERRLPLENLITKRFQLKEAFADKIALHRKNAVAGQFRQMMLPDFETPLETSPDNCFDFPLNQYPAPSIYEGKISFNKHYYEIPAAMNGEEADCAAIIDSLPEVEYWVRNLERDQFSFWLPTTTDKFYPDYVAKLKDGRYLVVEYKGAHLMNEDTSEKETIGHLWAARSNGDCVFVLATKKNMDTEIHKAIS